MNRINTAKLHRLIKTLKKEEKRFFKLFTKKQDRKGDVLYLKVFDYLDKLEEVDRDKFKKKFKTVKGLSGLQNYLYKLILKSLRNQPTYQDVDVLLREGLMDLEILYKKELFIDSQEKLEQLLEVAVQHDKVFFLPMLHEWWFILQNTYFHYHEVDKSLLESSIEMYTNSIQNLQQYHLYRTQLGRMMWLVKDQDSKNIVEDLNQIIKFFPEYDSNDKQGNIAIRIQELQFRRVHAAILMDSSKSYFYKKELVQMLKELPPKSFEVYEEYYYKALAAQMGSAPSLKILAETIEEIETFTDGKTKHLDNHLLIQILINKIDLYLLTGAFQKFEQFIQERKDIVELIVHSGSQYYRDCWYYKLMLYYYGIKDYTNALDTFEMFLSDKDVSMMFKRPSLYLKMIIYYEEEEYILLASYLKNFTRFLRKREALLDPEKQLITLMGKLIKLPDSEHKAILIQTRKEIADYLTTIDAAQKEFLIYFNYIGWMDSQIFNVPFTDLFFMHLGVVKIDSIEERQNALFLEKDNQE